MEILKQAAAGGGELPGTATEVRSAVRDMLADIDARGEAAVRDYAQKFDGWEGEFELAGDRLQALIDRVPADVRADIDFAHEQVTRFAQAQKDSLRGFEMETLPGVRLGQRVVPVQCAGCYVPGGRYAHASSALMSVATAKAAGVPKIIACSPPRGDHIDPAVAYAMRKAGADVILQMGGVHAIATLAHGLFTGFEADIIVGPGNAYVAEAKRMLFGAVGIDVIAGPTESAIIADDSADPRTIAVDLVSQAEHGPTSPVWLFTDSRDVAEAVLGLMPAVIASMPNPQVCATAWTDHGLIVLGDDREEVAAISDRYACEHLQVIARDLEWWKERLVNYGSLFLGEGSTVTHGDKCSGTNHILPTGRAARYSGGLNVQKFLKVLTWQELTPQANELFSAVGSRISRHEGIEGHARACDWRLQKYFPQQEWDFDVYTDWRFD